MATVIPAEVVNSRQVPAAVRQVAARLAAVGEAETWVWYHPPGPSERPPFLAWDPWHGLVAVAVEELDPATVARVGLAEVELCDGTRWDPVSTLGRQLTGFAEQLAGLLPKPRLRGLVALPGVTRAALAETGLERYFPPDSVWCSDDADWPVPRAAEPWPEAVGREVRARLYPETLLAPVRRPAGGAGDAAGHAAARIALDADQEQLARSLSAEVTWLTGVAGSGKSLVLAARARCLAAQHPDWQILVLCFNRSLVPYLTSLLGEGFDGVEVLTFAALAARLRIWLPRFNAPDYDAQTTALFANARQRGLGRHTWDAVLVDEGQDFHPEWLAFAASLVRPEAGGLVITTDDRQNLYDHDVSAVLERSGCETVLLDRNYRNTRAILEVARAAADWHGPMELAALEGIPVQCYWADSWDGQAACIGERIHHLVTTAGVAPGDIAVLLPKRAGTARRLRGVFAERGLPHDEIRSGKEAVRYEPLRETVKLLTVHSAKGLEFSQVFVMGLETLKEDPPEAAIMSQRLAYVAATRAKDVLHVTYTRTGPVIDRILAQREQCEFWTWPDDFEGESSGPGAEV